MHETLINIEALPVSAVILDKSGKIVGVNEVWKEFGRRNGLGLAKSGLGFSYLDHCGPQARGPASPTTSATCSLAGAISSRTCTPAILQERNAGSCFSRSRSLFLGRAVSQSFTQIFQALFRFGLSKDKNTDSKRLRSKAFNSQHSLP